MAVVHISSAWRLLCSVRRLPQPRVTQEICMSIVPNVFVCVCVCVSLLLPDYLCLTICGYFNVIVNIINVNSLWLCARMLCLCSDGVVWVVCQQIHKAHCTFQSIIMMAAKLFRRKMLQHRSRALFGKRCLIKHSGLLLFHNTNTIYTQELHTLRTNIIIIIIIEGEKTNRRV